MRRIALTKNNTHSAISLALKVLRESGLVVYPTETCYGIGADALNQKAVDKLLDYKDRPEGKAISVAVVDKKMALDYVDLNNSANNLYDQMLPGPLTIISKSKHKVAKGLEAEDGTLGIRIPDYDIPIQIIKAVGKPLTSTSANEANKKNPYRIEDILDNISERKKKLIDLIIDTGELPHNPPSTVIDTTTTDLQVLRQGEVRFMNKVKQLKSSKVEDTIDAGFHFINDFKVNLKGGAIVIFLSGDLGSGKTQFTKGIARALGIETNIKSPTYVFYNEYMYKLAHFEGKFFHVDLWKVEDLDTLKALKLGDMAGKGNVIAIEWPDAFMDELIKIFGDKATSFHIVLRYIDNNKREIVVYKK